MKNISERHAKIVATIGPASEDEGIMVKLVEAGMNVARMNFSHGTQEQHAQRIARLRRISERLGQPIAILQDLQGPKIRTGELQGGQVELVAGQPLKLTTQTVVGTASLVSVNYPDLPRHVQPGNRILLADGQMELLVTGVSGNEIETQVVLGGTLLPHKGVNLPGAKLDMPCLTPKDETDLAFGLGQEVDAVAMSFIRRAEDVEQVRLAITRLAPERGHTPIIAKLERPESLDNLESIMEASDGVMVARGDLGVEMPPEVVPIAQKRIIASANRHAKIVITATQMLESMIHSPRPTRAEASDVANAIFDGSDAVMLSAETATGQYPVETVAMMDAIICQAEEHLDAWGHWHGTRPHYRRVSDPKSSEDAIFITRGAREQAYDRNVAAIAVFTVSGRTALLMSKERPRVPILAFTPSETTYRQMPLFWGVLPHLVPYSDTVEKMLEHVEAAMIADNLIRPGQQVLLICGFPVGTRRPANLTLLHTVGQTTSSQAP
jgi:pyruvate kinase